MAKKKLTESISQDRISRVTYRFFDIAKQERSFLTMIIFLTFVCGLVTPYPQVAMWVGFALAGYSTIANDSIQTIGTFIASNTRTKWWYLWLFIGGIFLIAVGLSWFQYDGDVSSGRLSTKGFHIAPTSFSFLQLCAPLILLILTRLRMPVSTTFLILNSFSTNSGAILKVLNKSLIGYFLAFATAIIVWVIIGKFINKFAKGQPAKFWKYAQWLTSGLLWFTWVQQDAANIAIYLPRELSVYQFIAFAGYIFLGLGLLFYWKGDRIQEIVTEKSGVADIRAATIVDFVYAILLFYFKIYSGVPMSTTWVFIGLLGGRELAISFTKKRAKKRKMSLIKSLSMVKRDLYTALIGLLISLVLALAINDDIRAEIMAMIF
jgi:phosphate/sulfate permease